MKNPLRRFAIIFASLCFPAISNAQNVFPPNGNVGIGTANPNRHLHINENSTNRVQIRMQNGNSLNNGVLLGLNSNNHLVFRLKENRSMRFFTNDIERIRLSNNGYFGIGSSDPMTALHVEGDHVPGYGIAYYKSTSRSLLGLDATNSDAGVFLALNGTTQWSMRSTPTLANGFLIAGDDLLTKQYFFIDQSNGNTGIGTVSPSSKLTVNGMIESTAGGITFPDGTTQATAASDIWQEVGGDIYYNGGSIGVNVPTVEARYHFGSTQSFPGPLFKLSRDYGGDQENGLNIVISGNSLGPVSTPEIGHGSVGFVMNNPNGISDMAFKVANNGDGVADLILKADGKVGVGTSFPTEKFSVVGVIESTTGGIKYPDGSVQTTAFLGSGSFIASGDNATLNDVDVTGRLKVGTNSILIDGTNLLSVAGTPENHMYTTPGAFGSDQNLYICSPLAGQGNLGSTSANTVFNSNSNTGNVGIGTTDPTSKLHISSNATSNVKLFTMNNTGAREMFFVPRLGSNGYNDLSNASDMGLFWSDGLEAGNDENANSGFVIGPYQDGGPKGLRIGADGKVTIGTTFIPAASCEEYNLIVSKGILTEKVKVAIEGSGDWCDYVFEDNYDLRTISEVEEFIKENGHLPEVPSASEVIENGLNLAEMDAVLLKKVEELTLYVIQLDKKNQQLEAELKALKK